MDGAEHQVWGTEVSFARVNLFEGEMMGGGTDRGAGEICVWFCEEKQEFNRHEESSFFFFFWGVGRAQERERRS